MAPRWNDNVMMKFVTLYHCEPILWDTSNSEYKNKRARISALQRIIATMELDGFGIDECKKKIKNIRTHYWQEMLKIRDSALTGADPIYKPTVIWFEVVDGFLRKFTMHVDKKRLHKVPELEIKINLPPKEEHNQNMMKEEDGNSHLEESSDNLERPSKSRGSAVKRRKISSRDKLSLDCAHANEALNKFKNKETTGTRENETEFDVWAKSIAMQLNNMELVRALDLQLELQTIVSKERLAYETHRLSLNI